MYRVYVEYDVGYKIILIGKIQLRKGDNMFEQGLSNI